MSSVREEILGMLPEKREDLENCHCEPCNGCGCKVDDYDKALSDTADLLSGKVAGVEEVMKLICNNFAYPLTCITCKLKYRCRKNATALTEEFVMLRKEKK